MKKARDILCEECQSGFLKFFHSLDNADLQYLNEQKNTLIFKKGQLIYEEGHKSLGVFCIREGKIKVFKNTQEGKEHITRVVLPGEFLGLKALLSGNDHSVSASALEDSVICFISKTDFFQLMVKYPEFTRSLILTLSKLLEEAEMRMISLAYKPVRERLAETLLFLFNSFYPHPEKNVKDYLNLTRLDLANIIGTASETVIRLLSEFKDEELIAIKGRKIFLLNPDGLKSIATQSG
ncbi:MAG: Crp/Fnr family transcriptional regulator [Bacteroidetes bacterium]|nr:Crp/Fnr family transcriptional regulator [Bacteroidota bacterium]